MNHLENFRQHLLTNNYEPINNLQVNSSDWQRLMYDGEKPTATSGGCKITENPDGSLFASFGSSKDSAGFRSWRSNSNKEKTQEEIAEERTARASHRKFVEQEEQKKHVRIGARLERVIANLPVATSHPYLTDKKIEPHGIKIRAKTGELIIPRYGADNRIYSLQRIQQKKSGVKSWKGYFKGALGKDLNYLLTDGWEDFSIIALAEGFATGASIHEATGYPVYVCFDAGGLEGVAVYVRKKYPNARIFICADSDQWSFAATKKPKDLDCSKIAGNDPRWAEWRDSGKLHNTGLFKAGQAAAKVKAHVITPDFPRDHPQKFTDFNDAAVAFGKEYIKMIFEKILEIPQVKTVEETSGDRFNDSLDSFDVQTVTADDIMRDHAPDDAETAGMEDLQDIPPDDEEYYVIPDDGAPAVKKKVGKEFVSEIDRMPFRILGYNDGLYHYYPLSQKQIISLPASGHSIHNLLQLANLDDWERPYKDGGKLSKTHQAIALVAANKMIQKAKAKGVFTVEDTVRGGGAWIDKGRAVLHCGAELYVDGVKTRFEDMETDFTYVAASRLMKPSIEQLSNKDARNLRTICESVTWENKLSGTLLAGWIVVAPVCAALSYRPHVFITGEAESGKSTVMDKIIKPALGKMALCVDGGTTEPAIRETMGYDARPLVYDEAEPCLVMDGVIALTRKASTGSVVKKFNQRAFKANFCACFSAINPPVNKTADESRISFMHIKKNRKSTAIDDYDNLLTLIDETLTPTFPERMIARTISNMPALLANIITFERAMRRTIGGARASQQIGAMMAGVYSLGRTDVISLEEATRIVKQYRWTDHTIVDQEGDPIRLVQHIVSSLIKTRAGGEASIGELIAQARKIGDINTDSADKLLRYYGIAVKNDRVLIANTSQNLAKILNGTDWHNKWSRTLSDVAGAEKMEVTHFATGVKSRAISLPIALFDDSEAEELYDF